MRERVRAISYRYGWAIASVALLIGLRLQLDPILGTLFPFETLFLALLVSAWFGGRGPALLALALGILGATVFLLPERGSILVTSLQDRVGLLLFALSGFGIALLAGAMHTARRAAEAAAVLTRRQASLIEQTHDAILVWEWNGAILFWNRGAERLYGFASREALGRTMEALLRPARTTSFNAMAGELERKGSWEGELQFSTGDGHALIVHTRMIFLREERRAFVLEIDRDITDQKEAAAALRQANEQLETRVRQRTQALEEALDRVRVSETTFRLLVEGVQDHAIFMLDPAGTILTWNSGAERVSGFTSAEVLGKHYSLLFAPERTADSDPKRDLQVASMTGKVDVEGWRARKDGSRFWSVGALYALRDESGAARGFASITRDQTAKRRNDELLRSVLDHTVDGIVSTDERGIVSMINRAGEALFERPGSEVIGRNVNMLMPEPYRSEHDHYVANYLRTGQAKIIGIGREVHALKRGGATFPAALAVTEFRLEGERHFVGIVRDISAQKKLESQLHQAQQLEAFGRLAGGVAHDFNNLLTVICGYCDLLLDSLPADSETQSMAGEIRDAAARATSLTRQLLAFSRRQVLKPQLLDLNSVVTSIQALLKRLIPEDVKITTSLQPNLSVVLVDPVQIQQVIMNLAVNARDAMPRGGQLLIETDNVELDESYVRTHADARAGHFVMLAISDNGAGMSTEARARIFEPFFTTKVVGKGTGLGLAVVHGIVKQSGGSIDVYSEVGIGTTFKIYLPVAAGDSSGAPAPESTAAARGTETILLAEDEQGVRELATRGLRALGYTVYAAAGGRDALQIALSLSSPIDLLVTDVVMPDMTGRTLAEQLQRGRPQLRPLFVSGYTDDAVLLHGVLQSEVDFLQKPFTPKSLAAKVREVLDRDTRSATSDSQGTGTPTSSEDP